MNWIALAIVTAIFFGAYNVFIKVASGHINQIVGAVILQLVAACIGGGLLILLKIAGHSLESTQRGIIFAILAGIMVGIAEITSFYLFSKGISASVGIPIIIGGSIVAGTLLSILFLRESLHPLQYFGVVFIIAGIVLVTTR